MAALSPKGTFYLYLILSGLFTAGMVMLWRIGRALRHRHDRRHEVVDPAGRIWSTRLHWGRPSAGFGLGARLFPRRALPTPDPDAAIGDPAGPPVLDRPTREKKHGWFDWLDVFSIFDEGLLLGMGLVTLIGLVAISAVILLLAIELAVVALLAVAFGVLRGLFGHPWIIEVVEPASEPAVGSQAGLLPEPRLVAVRGLRAAVDSHEEIRREIAASGRYVIPSAGAIDH